MATFQIPKEVSHVTQTLKKGGFEAYIVGGCVRDLYLGRIPKDWDVTTNATPESIQALFEHTVYENKFGTVGVIIDNPDHESLKLIEVTPYRTEGKYSDSRHPDEVKFVDSIDKDLQRRDFTMNAIALDIETDTIKDMSEGRLDLSRGIIRAVGHAKERFTEDALRTIRAVRFASELAFTIDKDTSDAITDTAHLIKDISNERVRDEFAKILMSDNPMSGVILLQQYGLLHFFAPEIEEGLGVEQNSDHIYEVWEHCLRALNHAAERRWPLHVRLAALLHDVGKPRAREWGKEKNDWTFHGHDVVGAKITEKLLTRLHFPKKLVQDTTKLVRYHMFFSDIDQITLSAVRRIVRNVGPELVWDLMKVRQCDRIGMGRPKEQPYRLRKYEAMIEEAMRAPVTVGMLKIDGEGVMKITGLSAGPKIGFILHALLEEVLDDPMKNTDEYLTNRAQEMSKLSDDDLKKLGVAGKEKKEGIDEAEIAEIRKRHGVK